MGFFGSGDTKTSSNDNRAGASENAQLAQSGGLIFNGGGGKKATAFNYTPWIIVSAVVFVIYLIWRK